MNNWKRSFLRPFTMALQKTNYLGMNLTKYMKVFTLKNTKHD